MKMDLYMPVRVISGENCVRDNSHLFRMGESCVIVTGRNSAIRSGALDDVIDVLCELGIDYLVYDRICENPPVSVCFDGGQTAYAAEADFVIGIGGGSPLDAAKAIAAYAANPGISPDSIFNAEKLRPSLPIIAVPTTAGTGSEVNPYSILTIDDEDRKKTFNSPYSYPKYAFLDPRYTYSCGSDATVSCALDAFCHCIESYNSPKSTYLSELAAVFGAKKIWRELEHLERGEKLSPKTRERLQNAACAGGIAINATGTGFPHPMGYNLTFNNGIPHGRACAAFTGKYVERCMRDETGAERMTKFAIKIGATPEEIAYRIPRLAGVKLTLTEEEIASFIETVGAAKNFTNSHYAVSREEAAEIYRELFSE